MNKPSTLQNQSRPQRRSHFTLQLLPKFLQQLHIPLLRRPPNHQPFLRTRLWNHVKMHMIHLLVCQTPIILQDIVVLRARSRRKFLGYGQDFGEGRIGDIGQFGPMMLRDYEL